MSIPLWGILSRDRPETAIREFFKITLRPGKVRYLTFASFFRTVVDVERVIDEIRNSGSGSVAKLEVEPFHVDVDSLIDEMRKTGFGSVAKREVESPGFFFPDIDSLVTTAGWDERLRTLHALYCSLFQYGIPSLVYSAFHEHLRLGEHFAVTESVEAWVKGTERDSDLADSFRDSPDHIVIKRGFSDVVFTKTPFVQSKLDAILDAERQARLAEEAKQADDQAERLRHGRFTTFVYLMEDTRNGTFKIGRSMTPEKRERTLQSEVPETVLRFSIPCEESQESAMHERFSHRRIRGEWFQLSGEELVEIVNYLKSEGDAERATVDFEWLGKLFFRIRPPNS